MLQWQQATKTFLGSETEQDRICIIKQEINLMEFICRKVCNYKVLVFWLAHSTLFGNLV